MTTRIRNQILLPVLTSVLALVLANRASAQIFKNLHNFTVGEGIGPGARLILSDNILYGSTALGGSSSVGTVFAINTDGTGFTNLHSFTIGDGAYPYTELILWGNTLYGTARAGGSLGNGTLFKLNTDGTGFTNFYNFTRASDGAGPGNSLILLGNTLYGTAYNGGSSGDGSVFSVQTNGSDFTNLYSFTGGSDGAHPFAGLILSGNTFYGTTESGGSPGSGTVFALNTNGAAFTNLYSFTKNVNQYTMYTNNLDGDAPRAVILSGNTLYGTALVGGSSGLGTIFAVNTDGSGFTNLHTFTDLRSGGYPVAGLILLDKTLYGTTGGSGVGSDNGTIFAINTDGTGFTNLHIFTSGITNSDGAIPMASMILSGNTLYGTTYGGGSSGQGTVFSLSFSPQLRITLSQSEVVLNWPTNVAGFDYSGYTVQSITNLAVSVWTTNVPPPVVVNGQYTVTNPISGNQQFFRLSQ